ncbi:MAG: hypothetical protein IJJ21_03150, partial [Firmicutes bacterium]|nr:hypothetical protein [Bacillota bacterium]
MKEKKELRRIMMLLFVAVVLCIGLAGCGDASSDEAGADAQIQYAQPDNPNAAWPEPAAEAVAETAVGVVDLATAPDSPEFVGKMKEAKKADQLFIVAGLGKTTAYVSMHQKDENGNWKQI